MEYLIFAACIFGVGYSSYKIGVREGAERTVEKLIESRLLKIDHRGNLTSGK